MVFLDEHIMEVDRVDLLLYIMWEQSQIVLDSQVVFRILYILYDIEHTIFLLANRKRLIYIWLALHHQLVEYF